VKEEADRCCSLININTSMINIEEMA